MENLYNAVVSFKGDNGFTFYLPKYGELTVYNGKDVFIKGLTTSGVEVLRELRPLLLEHKLNGKPDGCYRVIDLTQITSVTPRIMERPEPVKSVADLKAELVKSEGPIVDEPETNDSTTKEPEVEVETSTGDIKTDELSTKAPVDEPKETKPAKKINKKGSKRGKLGKK